jgi:hypothetical protein
MERFFAESLALVIGIGLAVGATGCSLGKREDARDSKVMARAAAAEVAAQPAQARSGRQAEEEEHIIRNGGTVF